MFKAVLRNDIALGILVAALAFMVYLATVAPSIGYWDSAELAASAVTLGIAHPTGYPFYTLLSRAIVAATPFASPYASLNVMAAVFTAVSVFLFFTLCLKLLFSGGRLVFGGRASPGGTHEGPHHAGVNGTQGSFFAARFAAAIAALVFAFSRIVWSQAVSLEVYALHLVFFLGVTLLFLRALERPTSLRHWLLFAFALGLSFSHHMMMVLLAPGFLFLFFRLNGFGGPAWRRIAQAVPAFALGLTPYLYLPLRAAAGPVVNWGDPATFDRFWAHVSAAQYRFKMFSSADIAVAKLGAFFRDLPVAFTALPLCFVGVGLIVLFRRGGRLLPFTLLLWATCVAYAVNYDFDDPNFYLQAHAVVALWAAFGAHALLVRAFSGRAQAPRPRLQGLARWALIAACLLAVLMPFDANYRTNDRSADHAVEDYARTLLAEVEPNALILSGDLEGFTLGARYLQVAEGARPDVAVVGLGILAFPWYQTELEAAYPGLLKGLEREGAAYGPVRAEFERTGEPTLAYNLAYTNLVRALLREHVGRRPVYASFVPGEYFKGYRITPQGLLLRISPQTTATDVDVPAALPPPSLPARPIPEGLPYAAKVKTAYAAGFMAHAYERASRGETAEAVRLLRIVLQLDPENNQAREALLRLGG